MARITWTQESGSLAAADFEFTLTNGLRPSRGRMTVAAGDLAALERKGSVRVTVEFDGAVAPVEVTISDIYVESYAAIAGEGPAALYRVSLADRRVLWERFGSITLDANVLGKGGWFEASSLNGRKPYTWKELVMRVLVEMGEN